jgi:hypothetical protein
MAEDEISLPGMWSRSISCMCDYACDVFYIETSVALHPLNVHHLRRRRGTGFCGVIRWLLVTART